MNKLKWIVTEIVKSAVINDPDKAKQMHKIEQVQRNIDPTFTGRRERERTR